MSCERDRNAVRTRGCKRLWVVGEEQMRHCAHLAQSRCVFGNAVGPIESTDSKLFTIDVDVDALVYQHRDADFARGSDHFARRVQMIVIAEHHVDATRCA